MRGLSYLCQPTTSSEARGLRDRDELITSSEARGERDLEKTVTSSEARGLRDLDELITSSEARDLRDFGQPTILSDHPKESLLSYNLGRSERLKEFFVNLSTFAKTHFFTRSSSEIQMNP